MLGKWDTVCNNLEKGGLGLRDIEHVNSALLAKWAWNFLNGEKSLWKEVINRIYNYSAITAKLELSVRNPSPIWKEVTLFTKVQVPCYQIFRNSISLKLGDGKSISFWTDTWTGSQSLQSIFPRLFLLSEDRTAKIADMGNWTGGTWIWNLKWRRCLLDREFNSLESLREMIANFRPEPGGEDQVCWDGTPGGFSVAKFRKKLNDCLIQSATREFPKIWNFSAPFKIKVMIWMACHSRLPSKAVLARCGIVDPICDRCSSSQEDSDHCILICRRAWETWAELMN